MVFMYALRWIIGGKKYCLNFEPAVFCLPLSLEPSCALSNIISGQGRCLATAFQSEPDPPCLLVHKRFCLKHGIPICKKDSRANTCHVRMIYSGST